MSGHYITTCPLTTGLLILLQFLLIVWPAVGYSGMLMDQDSPVARPPARLVALPNRGGGKPLPLLPGLLDDTLLSAGSFSFGAKLVHFDKLRVLGNVYANKINGRPLREAYLLKSALRGQQHPQYHQPKQPQPQRTATDRNYGQMGAIPGALFQKRNEQSMPESIKLKIISLDR